jgi:hypothetical protein
MNASFFIFSKFCPRHVEEAAAAADRAASATFLGSADIPNPDSFGNMSIELSTFCLRHPEERGVGKAVRVRFLASVMLLDGSVRFLGSVEFLGNTWMTFSSFCHRHAIERVADRAAGTVE